MTDFEREDPTLPIPTETMSEMIEKWRAELAESRARPTVDIRPPACAEAA